MTPPGSPTPYRRFRERCLAATERWRSAGHPTITPLVLMISRELRVKESVTIFQSRWFEDLRIPEVDEIAEEELGSIEWTRKLGDRDESLRIMREDMIRSRRYAAAVFVGGMEGISDEYEMMKERWPDTPCIPVRGPGGAAAKLAGDYTALGLVGFKRSRAYPFMALHLVDALAGAA